MQPSANPPLGHLTAKPFFGTPAFVVLKSTPGAMNSVSPNKSVYLSAKRGLLKEKPPNQINYPVDNFN